MYTFVLPGGDCGRKCNNCLEMTRNIHIYKDTHVFYEDTPNMLVHALTYGYYECELRRQGIRICFQKLSSKKFTHYT